MKKTSFLHTLAVSVIAVSSLTLIACADKNKQEPINNEGEESPSLTNNQQEIDYRCKDDRLVTVIYDFNTEGYPTFAKFELEGDIQILPINKAHGDKIDTVFGAESSYMLATDFMNQDNVTEKSILITNSSEEIVYKDCEPQVSNEGKEVSLEIVGSESETENHDTGDIEHEDQYENEEETAQEIPEEDSTIEATPDNEVIDVEGTPDDMLDESEEQTDSDETVEESSEETESNN